MADIPSVTPSTPSSPASPVSGNTPHLSNSLVQQAPPQLMTPAQPVQVQGTVLSSNPQAQQMAIQTSQGQIVLQTPASLPPGTPVMVSLYTSNAQTRASLTVVRQQVSQTQTLEDAVQTQTSSAPPPPLQEGTTVTALQLQQPAPQPAAPPAQIDQVAASLEALKETGFQNVQLPLPDQVVQQLLTTPDIKSFLKQLPPQLLQNLAVFFTKSGDAGEQSVPGLLRKLFSAYLPQNDPGGEREIPPAAGSMTSDDDLVQIMRAPLQVGASGQSAQDPATSNPVREGGVPSLMTPLDSFISSLEGALPQKDSGFAALLRQFMPQGLQAPLPQNMLQLHILKVLPPTATADQIKALMQKMPAGAQLADVETITSKGQPILQVADEHFVLMTPASVPPGSKVIFESTPVAPEEVLAQGFLAAEGLDSAPGGQWPALRDALLALAPSSAAAQAIRNTLPTPTPQLVPTALFFLAALRSGNIASWLGTDALQALQQTDKKGLVDRLAGDFDRISSQSKDIQPGGWRAISIPLRHDNQISQMQFYVRRQQGDGEKERAEGGKPATRFILNLSLSRMGALQLDGYIHKKSFDMVLRTEDKLPFDVRQELMKRFATGLEQVNMQGGISFQTRQQGWMVPGAGTSSATEA